MKKINFALVSLFAAFPAFAEEAASQASTGIGDKAFYAIGACLVLGLAALGGTMGQGKVGAAAMEGIARNPQAAKTMNTPMILSLVFIESLVILSFVIAILIQGKF